MAQLAVAAIGAGVGYVVGGPAGAKWGWMIGSAVGAVAFAPDGQDGPRVTDGKFSANVYGEPIPLSYGTMRHAAHVLWWSGLHEHEHEIDGKGGKSITQFSYSCDLLLSVCAGPQAAVLRIWGNGRLLWTNDGTPQGVVDGEVLQPGAVRVYLGTEDQLPDPTYEAAVGSENAVPYRGEVVVAIDGLQLQFAGNRPPIIEVEVAQYVEQPSCPVEAYAATPAAGEVVYMGSNYASGDNASAVAYDSVRGSIWIASRSADKSLWELEEYDAATFPPQYIGSLSIPTGWEDTNTDWFGLAFDPDNDVLYAFGGCTIGLSNADHGKPIAFLRDGGVLTPSKALFSSDWGDFDNGTGANGGQGGYYGVLGAIYPRAGVPYGEIGRWSSGTEILSRWWRLRSGAQGLESGRAWMDESTQGRGSRAQVVYYVPLPFGFNIVCTGTDDAQTKEYIDRDGAVAEITGRPSGSWSINARVAHSVRRRRGYIMRDRYIAEIDLDSPYEFLTAFTELPAEVAVTPGFFQLAYDEAADHLVLFQGSATSLHIWTLDPSTYAVRLHCMATIPNDHALDRPFNVGPGMFVAGVRADGAMYGVAALRTPGAAGLAGNPTTLRAVVEDVCQRSGLPVANLDASAGTDLVAGFKIARQTTGRAAIQSLQPAYFFDMPESGTQLVLRKRGGAEVATIDSGELGARISQVTETEPASPYELEHIEEIEAPRVLELTYIDAAANYDPGLQRAERQAGASKAPAALEVPVSLSAMEAARIAYANLLHAHASKNPIRLALPHKFAALEPADPIIVPLASGSRRIRIDSVTRARPLIEITGVLEEAAVYQQISGGVPRYSDPTQEAVIPQAETLLALLDLPPLRDVDDKLLIYVAMAGADPALSWTGATLFKSADGGNNFAAEVQTNVAATMGTTVDALGDWTGGNVWDRENTVDVLLTSGTLSSASELAVLNEGNAILIGSEIVQFTTATLVDENTWRLSGLLRGRKGTEYAIAGHASGELVVLLDSALRVHEPASIAELGAMRHYKGVSANQALADVPAQAFTLAGNSVRPLSPVHIAGARAGDDLTITWVPRVRIDPYLRSGVPVTLDEPTEAYEIDILDGDTVVRTLAASSPTVIYTAADQTSDFGSPQGAIGVAIYQISTRAGRGHGGVATV